MSRSQDLMGRGIGLGTPVRPEDQPPGLIKKGSYVGNIARLPFAGDPVPAAQPLRRGQPLPLIYLNGDDEAAKDVVVCLAAPQIRPVTLVPPVPPAGFEPITDLVAIVQWGQGPGTSGGTQDAQGNIIAPVEVDWVAGTEFAVAGSALQVWGRWDNYSLPPYAWTPNPAPELLVSAFVSPLGSPRVFNPHRTRHFWNPIAVGGFVFGIIPAFARGLEVVSPSAGVGNSWSVNLGNVGGALLGTVASTNVVVTGANPIPEIPIPGAAQGFLVQNLGPNPAPLHLIFPLAF